MSTDDVIRDAIRRLMEFDKKTLADGKRKLAACCAVIIRVAMRETPVDLGQLRALNQFVVTEQGDAIIATVFNSSAYAPFVHQGTGIYALDGNGRKTPWYWHADAGKWAGWHYTVGQRPHPFMRNAVEQTRGDVDTIMSQP